MGLVKRKNSSGGTQPQYADSTTSTKLLKSDQAKFEQLCQRLRQSPAEVLRQIVNEALTRQEMLSRDEQDSLGVSQRRIENLMTDQLNPLRQEMQDLKGCLREIAAMMQDLPGTPVAATEEETKAMIERVLIDINQNILAFSNQIGADHKASIELVKGMSLGQDRAERWSQAAYVLNGHTFSWTEMILDLLARYVVIPQVGAMEPGADAALVMKGELEAGRQRARKKRTNIEGRLDLPNDGRIKFLSTPQE
ncbi:MAG: hypothetical protein ACREBG_17520 [Pyrinomonadaceae bacterium]